MAWFKKQEKEAKKPIKDLSELPELPPSSGGISMYDFSKNPAIKQELPPLPSFPTSSTGEMISREAVKQAIREEPEDRKEFFTSSVKMPPQMTAEIEEESFESNPSFAAPSFEPAKIEVKERRPSSKEPVYVRLDKYQEALSNFQEIKDKILEIDSLLKEIKNVRIKEESELQGWEREINEAKSKLNQIDSFLFKRLE